MTEGEYTRAKDPLKREQRPTVEEVYSGKAKASIGNYNNSEKKSVATKKIFRVPFNLLPAGQEREDLKLPECD